MTHSEKELIAVSIPEKHPSGTRRRAGFTITSQPSVMEVTEEERSIIKADPYITIHRRMSAAWFKAMGIDRTETNEKKYAEKDPSDWRETATVARREGEPLPTPTKGANVDPSASGEAVETGKMGEARGNDGKDATATQVGEEGNSLKVSITSSKADIITALEAKGKKAGADFDTDANRNALFAIYQAL